MTRIVLSDTVDPELEGPRAPTYLPTCWLPIAYAGEVSRDGCAAQSRCNGRAHCGRDRDVRCTGHRCPGTVHRLQSSSGGRRFPSLSAPQWTCLSSAHFAVHKPERVPTRVRPPSDVNPACASRANAHAGSAESQPDALQQAVLRKKVRQAIATACDSALIVITTAPQALEGAGSATEPATVLFTACRRSSRTHACTRWRRTTCARPAGCSCWTRGEPRSKTSAAPS